MYIYIKLLSRLNEVFLNEYVQLFSNPWVVGTKAMA